MAIRIDHLNKALATEIGNIELQKFDGYFTFFDDESNQLGESVMVNSISQLTKEQWMDLAQEAFDSAEEAANLEGDDEEESEEATMSKILLKYRATYVKVVSNSGNASLNNGDEVAALLQGLSPDETCAVADHLFGELPGTHFEKYAHLNNGSRRMNAGNRIRALIKRGEKSVADLEAAIKGDDLVDDEAAV